MEKMDLEGIKRRGFGLLLKSDFYALIEEVERVLFANREMSDWVGSAKLEIAALTAQVKQLERERDCWEQEAKLLGKNLDNYKKATAPIEKERDELKKELRLEANTGWLCLQCKKWVNPKDVKDKIHIVCGGECYGNDPCG